MQMQLSAYGIDVSCKWNECLMPVVHYFHYSLAEMIEVHGSTSDSGARSKSNQTGGNRLAVTVQDDVQEEKKGGCGC